MFTYDQTTKRSFYVNNTKCISIQVDNSTESHSIDSRRTERTVEQSSTTKTGQCGRMMQTTGIANADPLTSIQWHFRMPICDLVRIKYDEKAILFLCYTRTCINMVSGVVRLRVSQKVMLTTNAY